MSQDNKEERYQIIKVRNGCWRLETESGFISEHSTQQGAEKMLLQIQNKSTPQEEKVEVTEHQDGTIRANGIQIFPSTPQTPSWEEEFDEQFSEVILDQEVRTVVKGIKLFIEKERFQAKQEGRREGIEEAILEIIYGCARYTNMHQDTDDVNVAVNTVRADVLSKLDKKRK